MNKELKYAVLDDDNNVCTPWMATYDEAITEWEHETGEKWNKDEPYNSILSLTDEEIEAIPERD
jgi:hypothetical protein